MNNIILTVIGGGSVNWMRVLMKDIYMIDEIPGGQIRLVDPNTEHVNAVAKMLEAYNRYKNKEYEILIVKERKKALEGADFVMTTFSPGAMEAFRNDLEIPIKYGIRQPVSMTVGPCGISAALRTVPVAYEIVEEMEEACPNAWLLNVTNPMSVVTGAMNKAARTVKVVGMCHEFHALHSILGKILGLNKPEGMTITEYLYEWLNEQGFEYTIAGLNHFIWLTKATLNGKDVILKIREYCNAVDDKNNTDAVKMELCSQLGYIPIVGDRHLVEFYPSLCNLRNGFGMKHNVRKTTVDERIHTKVKQLEEINALSGGTSKIDWRKSGEEMTGIIKAIVTGEETAAIVNMPNRGQISNLPEGVVVETLATVGRNGLTPKSSGELPGVVGSLCRLHADVHELTVKAALEGSRDLLVKALFLDPLSGGADFGELPDLAEELLEANKRWLPRFF